MAGGGAGNTETQNNLNSVRPYARPPINNAEVKTVYALTSHEILTPSTTRFHMLAVPMPERHSNVRKEAPSTMWMVKEMNIFLHFPVQMSVDPPKNLSPTNFTVSCWAAIWFTCDGKGAK